MKYRLSLYLTKEQVYQMIPYLDEDVAETIIGQIELQDSGQGIEIKRFYPYGLKNSKEGILQYRKNYYKANKHKWKKYCKKGE